MGFNVEVPQVELREQILVRPFEFVTKDCDADGYLRGFIVGALVCDEEVLLEAMNTCQGCDMLIASESETVRCSGIGECGKDALVVLEDLNGILDFGLRAECLRID